jgi:hypothetical protein
MNSIKALISNLEKVPSIQVVDTAERILSSYTEWISDVFEFIKELDNESFCDLFQVGYRPEISPDVYLIHMDTEHRFEISVNHFISSRFNDLFLSGIIRPHQHNFDYTTRLIKGKYLHAIYKLAGDTISSGLELISFSECETGFVYQMNSQVFHMTLGPSDDTISLMVRGPRVAARTTRHVEEKEVILKRRDNLLEALSSNIR